MIDLDHGEGDEVPDAVAVAGDPRDERAGGLLGEEAQAELVQVLVGAVADVAADPRAQRAP